MSTQIVYTAKVFPHGTQPLSGVVEVNMQQPTSEAGAGTFRDDQFLTLLGLRASFDGISLPGGGVVQRQITLQMGPSSGATATVQTDGSGVISGITVTGQGLDYIQPPVAVIADSGKGAGAIVGPCSLQVLQTTGVYNGTGYVAPVVTAKGGLAPGGVPATFTATVVGTAITGITCTNPTTNGPYASPPTLVITDSAGSGANYTAQMGLFPIVPVIYGGSTFYSGPTISFTPYFKVLNPDAFPTAQANAVKGFMKGVLEQKMYMPVYEGTPVIS